MGSSSPTIYRPALLPSPLLRPCTCLHLSGHGFRYLWLPPHKPPDCSQVSTLSAFSVRPAGRQRAAISLQEPWRPHPPSTARASHPTVNRKPRGRVGLQGGPANRLGVVPACPGSRSEATKQQSRTSALMVTAKRAQLLRASIYRAGGGGGGRQGHTVTGATGRT